MLADNLLTRLRVELLGLEVKDGVPDLVRVGAFHGARPPERRLREQLVAKET